MQKAHTVYAGRTIHRILPARDGNTRNAGEARRW